MKRLVALCSLLFTTPMFASPALAADCPLDLAGGTGLVVFSGHYMIAFRPDPMRIEVGAPFALLLNVCTRHGEPAELIRVEASMPAHKHGMNYAATIVSNGNGRYRAEGMLFHMSGVWEVDFDVRSGEETERLSHEIILK